MPRLVNGRYLLLEELGHGAFGRVYRAEQRTLGVPLRQVAVKLFTENKESGAGVSAEETLKEALELFKIVEGCPDPTLRDRFVTCHDAGLESGLDGQPYLVMELVREDLSRVLSRGQMPVPTIHEYARQICEAVAFLHGKSIVHRDLKPANILISSTRSTKIGDFGLATSVDKLIRRAPAAGTLVYQPWEAIALHDWSPAADVYAIGLICYEMLTGRLPRHDQLMAAAGAGDEREPDLDALIGIKKDSVPPPSTRNPAVRGLPIEEIVQRALIPMPFDRYPDAAALLAAFDRSPAPVRPVSDRERVEALIEQAELAQAAGNLTLVERLCRDAFAINKRLPDNVMNAGVYRMLVEITLRQEDRPEASRIAQEGLSRRVCRETYQCMAAVHAGTDIGRAYARAAERAS